MSTNYTWHQNQSIHNIDVQKYLETQNPKYLDWEINSIFYASVKLVDAYMIKHGHGKPPNHFTRRNMIKDFLRPIRSDYRKLELLSKQSRYDGSVSPNDKTDALSWASTVSVHVNSNF